MCQSRGKQKDICIVCIQAMRCCVLDSGCQNPLICMDKLRCCGLCVYVSIFGSLRIISVGLSALKQNLKRSSSAKGRCNRSHYANVCFVCCSTVKTNTHKHTQVLRVWLAAGVEEYVSPLLLHLISLLSNPQSFQSCCQLPPLNLTSVSK